MTIIAFPPISQADRSGLLAVGGDLDTDSLLLAYRCGIFPWPLDESTLAWFAPPRRAVLFLEEFHISKRLNRERRSKQFRFTFNQAFEQVIDACSEPVNRGKQRGTWITAEIKGAYSRLFSSGFALSAEAWNGSGELTGGLYGVRINNMFAGESMFYREPSASKLALCELVDHLRQEGLTWIDCQVMTPLLASFGAREIPRAQFMKLLKNAIGD